MFGGGVVLEQDRSRECQIEALFGLKWRNWRECLVKLSYHIEIIN